MRRGMATRGRPKLADGRALFLVPGQGWSSEGPCRARRLCWGGWGGARGQCPPHIHVHPAGLWGKHGVRCLDSWKKMKGQEAVGESQPCIYGAPAVCRPRGGAGRHSWPSPPGPAARALRCVPGRRGAPHDAAGAPRAQCVPRGRGRAVPQAVAPAPFTASSPPRAVCSSGDKSTQSRPLGTPGRAASGVPGLRARLAEAPAQVPCAPHGTRPPRAWLPRSWLKYHP